MVEVEVVGEAVVVHQKLQIVMQVVAGQKLQIVVMQVVECQIQVAVYRTQALVAAGVEVLPE